MRQLIRHRTANVNEYSGRYSEMSDEFYVPDVEYIQTQSTTNKQGREEGFSDDEKRALQVILQDSNKDSVIRYNALIGQPDPNLSRELARTILPVSNYTECIWKIDLHNFFHMAKLRMDSHAQQEIQDFAVAMYDMVKKKFPISCEAFEDYNLHSVTLSRMEIALMSDLIDGSVTEREDYNMSKREWDEFFAEWCPY